MDPEGLKVSHINPNLRQYWYPVSLSSHLREGEVFGHHILGDPIVIYRDQEGKAVCLSDRCVHRSAPLSIGQVMNGRLECKYHGWQYDSTGKCVLIPALLKDRNIPANAVVHSYPCIEKYGFIWIWPGNSHEADSSEIPDIVPGFGEDLKFGHLFAAVFDLDVDHSLMVENLLDPAHLPFTHNGTLSKRSEAEPLEFETDIVEIGKSLSLKSSRLALKGNLKRSKLKSIKENHFFFIPPCFVILKASFGKSMEFRQSMICIPSRPGHMRFFYLQKKNFLTWTDGNMILDYITYQYSEKIVFQDYELLHGQQARLQQGSKAWHSPIQVDGLPKMYREWLKKSMSVPYKKFQAQDDYTCLMRDGPWFAGWKPCTTYNVPVDVEDVGDVLKACRHDPSIPSTNCSGADMDDTFRIPSQRGVNNSAYTWRRDILLGRNLGRQNEVRGWKAMLLAVGFAALIIAIVK